jgi:apolipoprotein N-acyltransferase
VEQKLHLYSLVRLIKIFYSVYFLTNVKWVLIPSDELCVIVNLIKTATMKSSRQSFVWLLTGTILMLFSNGRWIIPFSTWLYPVFFLRFMRMQKPARGFIFLVLASAIVNVIIWWRMIPAPISTYFIITGLIMQIFTFSFLADRLLATRLKGILPTLVFPVIWCSFDYLSSLDPGKASWTSLAYTQAGNLPLLQFTSITGIWGISFLITWFASVINWAWAQNFEWNKIRNGAITFTGVAGTIFLFGTLRINLFTSPSQTIRTASIVQARNINADLKTCKWTDAKGLNQYSDEVEDNLLEKTQQAAHAGAKMVLWQECAGAIPNHEEKEFIKRATAIAAQEKIYLLMTLWSVPADFPKHLVENKMVIIDQRGQIQSTYIKNNPVPTAEPIVKGTTPIPILETPYGKIAAAICYDGDFPNFIRNAGKNKTEIMFLPANDWKELDPIHTHMAITRAIENGFSLVRPSGPGLSVATDNRGKIISSMDFYTTDEQIMYADVPIQNTYTIYAQVGDLFAWLCIAGFILMSGWVIFQKYLIRENSLHKKDTNRTMESRLADAEY